MEFEKSLTVMSKVSSQVPQHQRVQLPTASSSDPEILQYHSLGYKEDFSPGEGENEGGQSQNVFWFWSQWFLKNSFKSSFPHNEKKIRSQLSP